MRTNILTSSFLIMGLLLSSCDNSVKENGNKEEDFSVEIPFITIAKNLNWGSGRDAKEIVIETQEEWKNLEKPFYLDEVEIDFDIYQVIVVIDRARVHMGYLVVVNNIAAYPDRVIVTVNQYTPKMWFTVGSRPYHIVKIPKLNGRFEFKYQHFYINTD